MIADRLKKKPVVVSVPQQPAEQQVQEQQPQQTPPVEKQETGSLQGVEQPTVSQTTTPAQPEIQGGVQSVEQIPTKQPQQITSYADIIGKLNEGIEQTPEEKQREARNKLIAGVGDAISSIANLVAVNRGAKNAYTPTLSAAYQQYYDKMQADRDARRQELMNYYYQNAGLQYKGAEAARDQYNKDRDYRFKVEEAKRDADWKEKEAKRKADADAAKLDLQRQNIESMIESRGKDAVRKDKIATAQINKYNADAAKAASGGKTVSFSVNGETITVPGNAWNESNINKIFSILEREKTKGMGLTEEEKKGAKKISAGFGGMEQPSYSPYTTEQKMELIGKYMDANPEVANALRELAGMQPDFSAYEDDTDTEAGEVDTTDYSQYKM